MDLAQLPLATLQGFHPAIPYPRPAEILAEAFLNPWAYQPTG